MATRRPFQEIDLATGGDGEYRGSTIPGRTVDETVMKARTVERVKQAELADKGMREALEPFAKEAGSWEPMGGAWWPDHVPFPANSLSTLRIGDLRRARAALQSVPVEEDVPDALIVDLRKRIDSVVEFSGHGCWVTCTGCAESSEGVLDSRYYPHSKVLGCQLGGGCSECGGIGAVWDDTDYDDMARSMLAEDAEPASNPDRLEDEAREITLAECPPGLFLFNGSLGIKTEYGSMEVVGPVNVPGDQIRWIVGGHVEAYVAESGEHFWGGAKTKSERDALLVRPVTVAALSRSADVERVREETIELCAEVADDHRQRNADLVKATQGDDDRAAEACWTAGQIDAAIRSLSGKGEG